MKITLCGVRGSIAVPGPTTVEYGGNTTCIFVETKDRRIVIDAGTGIRDLGDRLLVENKGPLTLDMFITHSHSDHIQGFPFFKPLYLPTSNIKVYGKLHYDLSVEDVMSAQMDYSYFPLPLDDLPCQLAFHDMNEPVVEFEDTQVKSLMLNHPVMMQCYRVESEGKTMIFTGDMEPYYDLMESSDTVEIAVNRNQSIIDFFHGVDYLIIDCSYTDKEYETRQGWGHNSVTHAVWFGGEAQVKNLILTHHEPTRHDSDIPGLLQSAKDVAKKYGFVFESIQMAKEGKVYDF
jgi:phosphoribosyl 1,2-cyclic phosphodiesterase